MATNRDLIRVAVTGSVAVAPVGTVGPSDATVPLSAQWLSVGYISDEGVTEIPAGNPTEIVPWRSSRAARTSPGTTSLKYKFAMLEANADALTLFYGDTVRAGNSYHHVLPDAHGTPFSVVLTTVDGTHVTRRWLPRVDVTERGERTASAVTAGAMPVTLTAYPAGDVMNDGVNSQAVVFYSDLLRSAGPPANPPQPDEPDASGSFGSSFGTDFG